MNTKRWSEGVRWLFPAMLTHLKRHGLAWFFGVVAFSLFQENYSIAMNQSASLPGKVYLIHKGQTPKKGEIASFLWQCDPALCYGERIFTKIVRGVPGELVSRRGLDFYVGDELIGTARLKGKSGRPLKPKELGPEGHRLAPGEFFMWSPHEDSFDSRYENVWTARPGKMVGTARRLI